MITSETIAQFRAQLRGELIEPGSSAYDNARKVYNAMIDKKPRLIAKCVDVAGKRFVHPLGPDGWPVGTRRSSL
jgi:hypothetical protein